MFFAYKLSKAVRLENDTILERIQTEQESAHPDFGIKQDRALLKARSDSLLNLKVIVVTMWFTSFFNLVYSTCVFFMFNEQCYATRISMTLNSIFTLLDRFDSYLLWFYPIIYLFWPTKRHIVQDKRLVKVL